MTDQELKAQIAAQKALMIAVATGGPRITNVNETYVQRRAAIQQALNGRGLADPNPFGDLWEWYGRWQQGDLPHYQVRRDYIAAMYRSLADQIDASVAHGPVVERVVEPTGWERVDRTLDTARGRLESARNEEDFQGVGHLCREVMISLAQAVYDPLTHTTVDGVKPSDTDAGRLLEGYIAHVLKGSSNETLRKSAKTSLALAVELQHRRTAKFRDAMLCMEATTSLVNIVAIVSGRRDISPAPRTPLKATTNPKHAIQSAARPESVFTRLGRILKLLGIQSTYSGRFTRAEADGEQVQHTLPVIQGDFHLHALKTNAATPAFWYVATMITAEDISKRMADIRVLLSECSVGQEAVCTFVLVCNDSLAEQKLTAYKTFEKMLVTVPEKSRHLFAFEVWDGPVLQTKEAELMLRPEDD